MRTKPFTFKKTVKKVETRHALEINVTVQEAADLRQIIGNLAYAGDEVRTQLIQPLYDALTDFVVANGCPKARVRMPTVTLLPT